MSSNQHKHKQEYRNQEKAFVWLLPLPWPVFRSLGWGNRWRRPWHQEVWYHGQTGLSEPHRGTMLWSTPPVTTCRLASNSVRIQHCSHTFTKYKGNTVFCSLFHIFLLYRLLSCTNSVMTLSNKEPSKWNKMIPWILSIQSPSKIWIHYPVTC